MRVRIRFGELALPEIQFVRSTSPADTDKAGWPPSRAQRESDFRRAPIMIKIIIIIIQ